MNAAKDSPNPERERALAHVEYAKREAPKIPDIPADTPMRKVERVAVIGAGTMGGGIAMSLANIGTPVTVIDADPAALERGLGRVRDNYASSVKRGRLDQAAMDERMALIARSLDIADVKDADLIVEAVFEDLALKQSIFRRLDTLAKPGAILATNTSGLDVNAIAAVTSRPHDVVGAHFFSPAHVMKLLEVVRADQTAPDVIATLMELGRRMGKIAVLARVYEGFIGNALFRNYTREAHFLVEEGALPHEVDAALTRFGYAMGIFAVHDLAGNDVGYQTKKLQMATRPADRRYSDLIMKLCDMGRLGQKSGAGWYRYEAGSRTPLRDPAVEDFIAEESKRLGIERQPIAENEIVKRCVYGMINEGAKLLERGIALRASDIDIVYVTGYGFPAHRGGPMYYADQVGLANVYADIERFHRQHGYWWQPAPLLRKLAMEAGSFAELDQAKRRGALAASRRCLTQQNRSDGHGDGQRHLHRGRSGAARRRVPRCGHPGQQQRRSAARTAERVGPCRSDPRARGETPRRGAADARCAARHARTALRSHRQRHFGNGESPQPVMGLSSAARAGLTALSEALSREPIADNVTMNNLLPERFDTPRQEYMAERMAKEQGITREQARRQIGDSLPARRFGRPEEFGGARVSLQRERRIHHRPEPPARRRRVRRVDLS